MPIYEYECKTCGVRFERKQTWSEDPVKTCPDCSGEVRKVLQPVGIVFKGSGFYKTDNASSGSRRDRAEQEKKDEPAPVAETKPSDKSARSESKPEPKPESRFQPKSEPRSESKSESQSEGKAGATSEPSKAAQEAKG